MVVILQVKHEYFRNFVDTERITTKRRAWYQTVGKKQNFHII